MGIINVKISSLTIRKTLQVSPTDTLADTLNKAGVATSGDVTVSLSGVTVSQSDLGKNFTEFNHLDMNKEIVLAAIVNSKNA